MDKPAGTATPRTTVYYDREMIAGEVARGEHRKMVGGLWEELGLLQFTCLQSNGLKPGHTLLDIGCGCLRGGVHFARYLEPGHYFGIDANQSLIDAGRQVELVAEGLVDRVPQANLRCCEDFDIEAFGVEFDMAVAVSLFTHLPAAHLRVCLERLAPQMHPGGRFFASFFLLPKGAPFSSPFAQTPDITTHPTTDPYHYRVEDIRNACLGLPWAARIIGDWAHPRNQKLVVFERDAKELQPGDANYRAYVGPPERYDFMGASQFALLFQLGLREDRHVLDFGCGSLRLGRLLIPWLQPGHYYGIDPNLWLIESGFEQELGADIRELKQPVFSHNDDFDCTVFGQTFDYIVAQSILTHCGPDFCVRFLDQVAKTLTSDGLAVFSYIRGGSSGKAPADGWHYPQCVAYPEEAMLRMVRAAGLAGTSLPWHHPGAAWMVVARRPELLPTVECKRHLSGLTFRAGSVSSRAMEIPPSVRRPNPLVPLADQEEAALVSAHIGLGRARLVEPANCSIVAGTPVRLCLEFTAGRATVAAGGKLYFCFHHVCTWSPAQTTDPGGAGYVLAKASNGATLQVRAWGDPGWDASRMPELFPWQHAIELEIGSPGLYPGDTVSVTYGAGPARALAQSFESHPYQFRVMADPQHLGVLLPAEEQPSIEVVGGSPARLVVLTPSDHVVGELARVLVKVEDAAGNLATDWSGEVVVEGPSGMLPGHLTHRFQGGEPPCKWFEGVAVRAAGYGRFVARGPGGLAGESNPFRVWPRDTAFLPTLWGEIHGHCALSDGYGSPESYFAYARDVAGLDLAALTDHDFMLSDSDWVRIKSACNAANAPGRFVTLQAYEWTGECAVGGDRNVYFRGDDPPISRARTMYDHRNMHLYHGPARGANHVEDLYRWLDEAVGEHEALVIPHWGGRPADARWLDPRYEGLVEIFSEHQNSEKWSQGFRTQGMRLGVVAGGDDHIGRPGNGFLAYTPGFPPWSGSGKGLVAVLAQRNREDVFQALRRRRAYATTGARILVQCEWEGLLLGEASECSSVPAVRAAISGTDRLRRIEVLRDGEVVHVLHPGKGATATEFTWRDERFLLLQRECAYWLRVEQVDGHLAVTSPVWLVPPRSA